MDVVIASGDPTLMTQASTWWHFSQAARSDSWRVRHLAAQNSQCPPQVLVQLANDRYLDVRYAVAENPNCPEAAFALLARDDNHGVRRAVARNSHCPPPVLRQLERDRSELVRAAAARPSKPNLRQKMALA